MYLFQSLFSDAFIHALGWTVLHSLWQGVLIALLLAGSMLLLQRRSATLRYRLAAAALVGVLLSSVLTFAWLYETPQETLANRTVVIEQPLAEWPQAVETDSGLALLLQQWGAYFETHIPLIVVLWLLGLSFFLLRIMGGLTYVEYLKVTAVRPMSAYWQRRFELLQQQLGDRHPVMLLESGVVNVPMVVGWLKPVILIPIGTLNALSPEQVEAVIAHELAHIYRRDYLFNILQSLIEALYYFNPAVWWISAYIRMEREHCCDDMALDLCGNSLDYAKALMQIEQASQRQARMAMAMARKGKGQLLMRVKRILNQPQNKIMMIEKFTATAMLMAALLFFSVSAVQPEEERQAKLDSPNDWTIRLPESSNPQMALFALDSLPKGQIQIRTDHDGKSVDAELKDGNIVRLEIDGETIPEADFPEYEGMLEEMLSSIPPPPPAPPAPPRFPAPPAPPAPPALSDMPAPPAPPKVPKAPKPPKAQKRIEVIKEKGNKTSKMIIIDEDGQREVVELKPFGGDKRIIVEDDVIIMGDSQRIVRRFETAPRANTLRGLRFEGHEIMEQEELERIVERAQREAEEALRDVEYEFEIEFGDMDSLVSREFEREFSDLKIISPGEGSWGYKIPKGEFEFHDFGLMNTTGMKSSIERQMLKDGFIEDTDDYKFVLKGNGVLRINGKRMQDGVYDRYKRIYERESGMKLEDGDEIKINR
jgi:beta-lactamase regulating signal transducer with metallopeptidase domain